MGVSTGTIKRIVREIRPALEELERKRAAYRAEIGEKFPIADRFKRYRELAVQADHPIAALKSLVRIDELDGLVIRASDAGEQRETAPMFSLPPGSRVAIVVGDGQASAISQGNRRETARPTAYHPEIGEEIPDSQADRPPGTPPKRDSDA